MSARFWGHIAIQTDDAVQAGAVDLSRHGIGRNTCVDGALPERLFAHDEELMNFLGPKEHRQHLKGRGQRTECGCIVGKDIGPYDTCPHACRYCDANSSPR